MSVAEHMNLTFNIQTSRGCLQQLVRHRISSYTVKSTRYCMQSIINAFIASKSTSIGNAKYEFEQLILAMDMFTVQGIPAKLEAHAIYDKLQHQVLAIGSDKFNELSLSKDALTNGSLNQLGCQLTFKALELSKSKRNSGDHLKWIVTDTWKTDLVMTLNLRSLKNLLDLRLPGSAYFEIRNLAKEIVKATPDKYLKLILKQDKINQIKEPQDENTQSI